ncbi:retrovirus-related pol polyprotein from transposon TNT 1-94 [Tanacetum coccineum]
MFIDATWLLDYSIIAYEQGICLLAWMGWYADIEGRGLVDDTIVSIPAVERPWLTKAEGFKLPNHNTADESSVCSTLLTSPEKLAAPTSKMKNVKTKDDFPLSIVMKEPNDLKLQISKNQPSYSRNNKPQQKCERTDHRTCDHPEYMSSMNMSQHLKGQGRSSLKSKTSRPSKPFLPCIHCGFNDHLSDDCVNYPICDIYGSYDHDTHVHTTTDHNDIEWFKRGEALQAKKAKAFQSKSSNAIRSKTPIKSGCSRHMTGVKSYLHKYVKQPGPKVVFGDDSTCITEGYGSIKCSGIVFTKVAFVNGLKYNLVSISKLCDAKYIVQFDEKRGSIFNSNKEIVMISLRVSDVYVLDMTSSAQESYFFAKATKNHNWIWHKRLAHLNFKTINQLAKQNHAIGLPSLVYSKDKPCSSCENGKHHKASFKTKHTSSIKKCLHLFHIDLFGPITPRSIKNEKYTFVIIDEYSRYTWVYFLKKKSQAPETIMSFIKIVENQNDIKVKQLRTDNGTEFRNSILVNFCDERGILQNFSSPYTPEQNGVAERKNRILIEAARTMLLGSVFSKQYWTEAVATTCYTQNRPTIVKRHLKTPYECGRITNIDFLYVFGCPVCIYNHKDYLEKFDEKADDGYFLRYSLVSKAFRVFNTKKQQTKKTYHITFDESTNVIKFIKPSVDNINIAESERYPPDEYFHPYEPSQRWSQDKHIELVNIIDNPGAGMLTRAMAKELSAASAHECLFVHFLSEEEPKKVSETFKHPGWVDAMQEKLNQFAKNKVWTLVPAAYGKTIIGSKWIKQSKRGISINQGKYVNDLLKKYDINGSSVKTPMVPPNNLGPDLNGKAINETQYLKGTPSLGLWYPKCSGFNLKGYSNSDYAGCNMVKKSTSARCCANILWMKSQLNDYDIIYEKVPIFCDNTSAIAISNNPILHSRTKHIDIRYHFIRDHVLKGDIELHFIPTQYQLADIFTKPLDEPTFKRLIYELAFSSEVTKKSHMSHSWICMSMCGLVAFDGALVLIKITYISSTYYNIKPEPSSAFSKHQSKGQF